MMQLPTKKNQRGVALIMAMMIVALVAVIAIEISWRFELSISRAGNRWHGIQARSYLEGAEHLAMVVLKEDADDPNTSKVDHMGETWAQESEPFPTDHGWVKGTIVDAHGRFNLNTMIPGKDCPSGQQKTSAGLCPQAQSACEKYYPAQRLFVRLLQTINLGTVEEPIFLEIQDAELITEAVIDWVDENSDITGFGGAESDHYEQLTPPISIANGPMVSVSELQVIKGMTPVLYKRLLPFIVALPETEVDKINVNTASASVLRTLTPKAASGVPCDLFPLSEQIGSELEGAIRGEEDGIADLDGLKGIPSLPSDWLDTNGELAIDQDLIMFEQSTYFLFFSEAAVGEDHIRRGQSLIKRTAAGGGGGQQQPNQQQGPTIEVVRRTDANF